MTAGEMWRILKMIFVFPLGIDARVSAINLDSRSIFGFEKVLPGYIKSGREVSDVENSFTLESF